MPSTLLSFERLTNIRDLTGMQTPDGRTVRPGKLIRCGHLANLTDRDQSALTGRVSVIADFRSYKEKSRQPDREISGAEYHHIPIVDDLTAGISREEESDKTAVAMLLLRPKEALEYMCNMYRAFALTDFGVSQYAKFIRILEQPHDGAVLWHCTAGKDRAGIGAVLIEEILGIDREDILEDYHLTNLYLEKEIRFLSDMIKKQEKTDSPLADESLKYLFGADEQYLRSFYAAVDQKYGSMQNFLEKGLGVTPARQAAMQEMYLS